MECGLSTLFTPIEPLADEVQSDARYDFRRDGHQERCQHINHLLSRKRKKREVWHEIYFNGKIFAGQALKIFSACDTLCAVDK